MQLKEGTYIDATKKGSIARFLNHSCEPNCRVEVWSVNSRYRVGVFALKDIEKSTELTIDYEWEPRLGEPLTPCLCGSVTCRGHIEVIDSSYLPGPTYNYKKGVWSLSSEVPEEAKIGLTNARQIDPLWLINHRIRVWWEGNLAYFEADVEGYNEKSRKHVLRYLIDSKVVEEQLYLCLLTTSSTSASISPVINDSPISSSFSSSSASSSSSKHEVIDKVVTIEKTKTGNNWLWLDESKQAISIKKKTRIEETSSSSVEWLDGSGNESTTTSNVDTQPSIKYATHISISRPESLKRQTVKLSILLARYLTRVHESSSHSQSNLSMTTISSIHDTVAQGIVKQGNSISYSSGNNVHRPELIAATNILTRKFSIKIYLPDDNEVNINETTAFEITIVGNQANVLRSSEYLENLSNDYRKEQNNKREEIIRAIEKNVKPIITKDWRIPSYLNQLVASSRRISGTTEVPNNSIPILQCLLAQQPIQPRYVDLINVLEASVHLNIPVWKICYVQIDTSNSGWASLSSISWRNLLNYIRSTTNRLQLSSSVAIHAVTLCLRSITFTVHDVNDDVVSNVAVFIILALKARGEFRAKLFDKVVIGAYCEIYKRDEATCTLNNQYFRKARDRIHSIWISLDADLYVSDMASLILSRAAIQNSVAESPDHVKPTDNILITSKAKNISNEERHKKRKKNELDSRFTKESFHKETSVNKNNLLRLELMAQLGSELAIGFATIYPGLYLSYSSDLIRFGCSLLASLTILELQNTNQSQTTTNGNQTVFNTFTNVLQLYESIAAETLNLHLCSQAVTWVLELIITILTSLSNDLLLSYFINSRIFHNLSEGQSLSSSAVRIIIIRVATKIQPELYKAVEFKDAMSSHVFSDRSDITDSIPSLTIISTVKSESSGSTVGQNTIDSSVFNPCWLESTNQVGCDRIDSRRRSLVSLKSNSVVDSQELCPGYYRITVRLSNLKKDECLSLIHQQIKSEHDSDDDDNQMVEFTLRSWPTKRQSSREHKKKQVDEDDSLPHEVSTLAIAELMTIQHLHASWISTPNHPDCPYVILPIGLHHSGHDTIDFFPKVVHNEDGLDDEPVTKINSLYYLITLPLYIPLTEVLKGIASGANGVDILETNQTLGLRLDINFIISMCADLYSLVDHCISSGVYLKWFSVDQLFLSAEGRLVLGSLDGAVLAYSSSNQALTEEAVKRQLKLSKTSSKDKDGRRPLVPISCLSTSSPEILLGSASCPGSCAFITAATCSYLISGKPVFKSGNSEHKYLKYVFQVIGSPRANKYNDFYKLPLALMFLSTDQIEDDSNSKSRIHKILRGICPSHLTVSSSKSFSSVDSMNILLEKLSESLHLNPKQRSPVRVTSQALLEVMSNLPSSVDDIRMSGMSRVMSYLKQNNQCCLPLISEKLHSISSQSLMKTRSSQQTESVPLKFSSISDLKSDSKKSPNAVNELNVAISPTDMTISGDSLTIDNSELMKRTNDKNNFDPIESLLERYETSSEINEELSRLSNDCLKNQSSSSSIVPNDQSVVLSSSESATKPDDDDRKGKLNTIVDSKSQIRNHSECKEAEVRKSNSYSTRDEQMYRRGDDKTRQKEGNYEGRENNRRRDRSNSCEHEKRGYYHRRDDQTDYIRRDRDRDNRGRDCFDSRKRDRRDYDRRMDRTNSYDRSRDIDDRRNEGRKSFAKERDEYY